MKILIAVFSCSSDIEKGHNRVIRETWGKNLPPNVDLRFLIGTAQPGPISEEDPAWQADFKGYSARKPWLLAPPPPLIDPLLLDELELDVPDGYFYLTHKARAAFRWAVERNYDYVFRCDTDTFIRIPQLLASGFEEHDYVGRRLGPAPGYAYGGPSMGLSNKALRILADAPITITADDVWVGETLKQHGILLHDDRRYCHLGKRAPDAITMHLSTKSGIYDNRRMISMYRTPFPETTGGPSPNSVEVIVQGRHLWIRKPQGK